MPKRLLSVCLLVLLAACGGGGGGRVDPGGGGGPGILPTGGLSGPVEFATGVAAVLLETEPNDALGEAPLLGEVVLGDLLTVEGTTDPASDAHDGVLVSCPEALTLEIESATPAFATFSLEVLDATADLLHPIPLASLPPSTDASRNLAVSVPAGTLLHIDVSTSDGGGAWRLTLEGMPPSAAEKLLVRPPIARVARVQAEGDRLDRRIRARYGRPIVEVAPGEALLRYRDAALGATQLGARAAKAVSGSSDRFHRVTLEVPPGLGEEDRARYTLARVAALAGASGAAYCEPHYVRHVLAEPDDTYYGFQWHYPLIHLPEAWDLTTGDPDVIVAVIDTGRTNHPDLDGDGTICEDGDYCGAWPLLGEPETVRVIQGLETDRVDFQVTVPASLGRWPVSPRSRCTER